MTATKPLAHDTSPIVTPSYQRGGQGSAAQIQSPAIPAKARPFLNRFRLRVSERRLSLAAVDILVVNLSLLIVTSLLADFVPTADNILGNSKWFITLTVVWLLSAVFFDCYNLARSASVTAILRSILLAALVSMFVYTFIPFLTPPLTSRGLIYWLVLATAGSLVTWRLIYARVFVQPGFQQRALVVGAGQAGQALAAALRAAPTTDPNPYRGTGYQLVGFIDDNDGLQGATLEGVEVLGDHRTMIEWAKALKVDEVILAITQHHVVSDEMFDALLSCRELGLRVVTMASVYERLTGRVPIEHVGRDLQMVVPMDDNAGERIYQAAKRVVDLASAVIGIAIMGLLIPFLAIGNALAGPGPLFYKQRRVGQGGKLFEVYKFRSMQPDAEKGTGAVWASKNDDRITPIGRFLRKTRLDELPQFINVLKGEMSLIGPRPERPEFVNALSLMIPFYRARHAVKPGITGWAQIRFGYGSSHQDARIKLEHDLYYVKHASPWLDTIIVLQTPLIMLLSKGT
jgi:exopolysaccharide biosynthesis polyprenyl glycosylphosphotransferase